MCDFRPPPDYVINPYTNEPSGYSYNGVVDYCEGTRWKDRKIKSEVEEEGVYYICATGGGYDFYLNGKWWGYNYMYWQDDSIHYCVDNSCFIIVNENELNPFFDYKPFGEKIWIPINK